MNCTAEHSNMVVTRANSVKSGSVSDDGGKGGGRRKDGKNMFHQLVVDDASLACKLCFCKLAPIGDFGAM